RAPSGCSASKAFGRLRDEDSCGAASRPRAPSALAAAGPSRFAPIHRRREMSMRYASTNAHPVVLARRGEVKNGDAAKAWKGKRRRSGRRSEGWSEKERAARAACTLWRGWEMAG